MDEEHAVRVVFGECSIKSCETFEGGLRGNGSREGEDQFVKTEAVDSDEGQERLVDDESSANEVVCAGLVALQENGARARRFLPIILDRSPGKLRSRTHLQFSSARRGRYYPAGALFSGGCASCPRFREGCPCALEVDQHDFSPPAWVLWIGAVGLHAAGGDQTTPASGGYSEEWVPPATGKTKRDRIGGVVHQERPQRTAWAPRQISR